MANDTNTGPTSALANLAARLLAAKEGGMVPPMEERPDGHPVDILVRENLGLVEGMAGLQQELSACLADLRPDSVLVWLSACVTVVACLLWSARILWMFRRTGAPFPPDIWIFYILTQLVALIYWIHIAIREWRGADENNDEEEERAQALRNMGEPYSRVVTGATPAVTARSALSASTGATANPDSATPLEPEKSKVEDGLNDEMWLEMLFSSPVGMDNPTTSWRPSPSLKSSSSSAGNSEPSSVSEAETVILDLSAVGGDTGRVKEEVVDELAGLLAAASPISRRLRPRPARPAPPVRKARATKEKKPKI